MSPELPDDAATPAAPTFPAATAGAALAPAARARVIARRFVRRPAGVVGSTGVLLLVLLAVAGPLVTPWAADDVDTAAFLRPPSPEHPFGTTQGGRDVLAITVAGLQTSLLIGFGVALVQTAVAAAVGMLAAWYRGWVDRVALWVTDLLLVVPPFLVVAVVSVPTGDEGATVAVLVLLLAGLGWMLSARVVRSVTLGMTSLGYVTAARYMSVPGPVILVRHVLPNLAALLVVDATLALASGVLAETSLSYLGFGIRAPATSLGTLIAEGQATALTYPWVFLAPAAVLTLLLVCVSLAGDALREALDAWSRP